jgi:hypothetical protein
MLEQQGVPHSLLVDREDKTTWRKPRVTLRDVAFGSGDAVRINSMWIALSLLHLFNADQDRCGNEAWR